MAIPPTVVTGETISISWGNAVRDWAVSTVLMGGAAEAVNDTTLSTTYETGATVTFTKPSDWVTFDIQAWGAAQLAVAVAASGGNARVQIGASNGPAMRMFGNQVGDRSTPAAAHSQTGLSANVTINLQYNEDTGTVNKEATWVRYMAIRVT